VSGPGCLLYAVAAALVVLDFQRVDARSHSASDTLLGVFPVAVLVISVLHWIASRCAPAVTTAVRRERRVRIANHAALLLLAALALALCLRGGVPGASMRAFALAGGLYGTALVAALRPAVNWPRGIAFVLAAALLSAATAWVAMGLYRTGAGASLPAGVPLAVAAAGGAAAYGVAIRALLALRLAPLAIAGLAVSAGVATLAAVATLHLAPLGPAWWLAVTWWCAFSVTLCVVTRRPGTAGETDPAGD
jgi:hypothetical protein